TSTHHHHSPTSIGDGNTAGDGDNSALLFSSAAFFRSASSNLHNPFTSASLPLLPSLISMLHAASPAPGFCLSCPRNLHCPRDSTKALVRVRFSVRSVPESKNGATKVEYTPWLVVGLGNPGSKYHGTRHNVGFEVIDNISKAEGIRMNTIQSKALIGIGSIGDVPILLAKPQTYMNFSGESVGPLAAYYQVPLRHILVVYDEMSLPNGVLRLQPKGGHGYHNGLKNVMGHLDGSHGFPRLSIGIGNPPGSMDVKAFLLQKFSSLERKQIDSSLDQGVEAVRTLVLNGFNNHVYRFNLGQKYKYHKKTAMATIAKSNVSLKQTLQTHHHQPNPSLDSLFHALDPISLILNPNNNNNSVSILNHSVLPMSLTTQSFIIMEDMERGPRYEAYAELRERKLRMKYPRQQEREEEESEELEPKQLPTPPRKQVKFQSGLRKGSSVSASALAQSVPDFSAVLRKENRKPVNALPSVMELTPPSKSYYSKGGVLSSSSRGSKSANAGEKKKGGGILMARKSYATMDELRNFTSATANAINGEGSRGVGRNNGGRVVGRTVLGYRQL
ncbi:hypothetical protein S245_050214, partial [Arachis hypogaea]